MRFAAYLRKQAWCCGQTILAVVKVLVSTWGGWGQLKTSRWALWSLHGGIFKKTMKKPHGQKTRRAWDLPSHQVRRCWLERHNDLSLPYNRLWPQNLSWQNDRRTCLREEAVLDPSHCPCTDSKMFQKLGTQCKNISKQLKVENQL